MKRKSTLLLAFLLMLYIAPAISAYDNISPDSITSWEETLPDDVMFYPDNETHGSGYAESFAGVDDWTYHSPDGSDSISSDGDVMTMVNDWAGGTDTDYIYTNTPSGIYPYYEIRYRLNDSSVGSVILATYSADSLGGSNTLYQGMTKTTSWNTFKIHDADSIECIALILQTSATSEDAELIVDYLRAGPANESGWQHDCSTVANTTALRVDVESDGDHIQFQYSGGGGTGELSFHTDFGGSAIAAIDTDYYSFIGWNVVNLTDDFYEVYVDNTLVYTGTGLGLQHVNVKASGEVEYTTITFVLNTVTESMALDWIKGYSIANFTLTLTSDTLNDYLYVDSGVLYSHIDSGYIEANHDPVLAVNGATYPIYNLTTSGAAPEFSMYVSEWSTYSANTRGATTSGNITDIKLRFNSNEILSAIKFIEEITMEINIFNELFLSTEIWGYFGPLGLVVIGYLLIQKAKALGIFMVIVDSLVISHYLTLVAATPNYWWHIIILLLGVIQCVFQMIAKR